MLDETEQDAILLEVEKGVGNLHQYSKAIGEEATLHNVSLTVFAQTLDRPMRRNSQKLLGEMDTDVDRAQVALKSETDRAEEVSPQPAAFVQCQLCCEYELCSSNAARRCAGRAGPASFGCALSCCLCF